ncbi:unnamed protein product [Ceratitis capitata]|uniref:(Mediterranean fruit fly) hypothetical protein n=1 Tax=Ceratitis capitata TaxID=7213 RepID=A0A811VBG1_CERCA|nr:unnamed protein product [Ceratitis capitata]
MEKSETIIWELIFFDGTEHRQVALKVLDNLSANRASKLKLDPEANKVNSH